MPTISDLARYC
ncbi:hypothetical protein F383_38342 [Gossypium arboreum]|uniref:Uncharacterized protein n=1 Tax=Gossypium arboreum TaxID=29729 RepID=A0A0B0MF21_GOSAR|nr:hypothetical protein F383_38342 [Gossypium arboreum]